jgi:hypothetical protein
MTYTEAQRGMGGVIFAGTLMMIGGFFWFVEGLAGIVNNAFYRQVEHYFDISVTTWGWVHLLLGVVVAAAGVALLAGQTWARVTAIVLASLSAIVNFFFIPWYPFWAITIIAVDLWIIHSLAVYKPDQA